MNVFKSLHTLFRREYLEAKFIFAMPILLWHFQINKVMWEEWITLVGKGGKNVVRETSLRNSTWMTDEKYNRTKLDISQWEKESKD